MDEQTRTMLINMARVLESHTKELQRLRCSVEKLLEHYADGDLRKIQTAHDAEHKTVLESLKKEPRQQVDSIIGALQRLKQK